MLLTELKSPFFQYPPVKVVTFIVIFEKGG